MKTLTCGEFDALQRLDRYPRGDYGSGWADNDGPFSSLLVARGLVQFYEYQDQDGTAYESRLTRLGKLAMDCYRASSVSVDSFP